MRLPIRGLTPWTWPSPSLSWRNLFSGLCHMSVSHFRFTEVKQSSAFFIWVILPLGEPTSRLLQAFPSGCWLPGSGGYLPVQVPVPGILRGMVPHVLCFPRSLQVPVLRALRGPPSSCHLLNETFPDSSFPQLNVLSFSLRRISISFSEPIPSCSVCSNLRLCLHSHWASPHPAVCPLVPGTQRYPASLSPGQTL